MIVVVPMSEMERKVEERGRTGGYEGGTVFNSFTVASSGRTMIDEG
jgi:hypothetical protein